MFKREQIHTINSYMVLKSENYMVKKKERLFKELSKDRKFINIFGILIFIAFCFVTCLG